MDSRAGAEPLSLSERIKPFIEAHKGQVAIAIKNLQTGETYFYHENVPMPTASLIKFPVMIEAYRQKAERKLDFSKMLTLREADKVPGSGVLTDHFSAGASFSLRDGIQLMIALSDNTATNLLLDEIGLKSTAETMEAMGYPNTKLHSKVYHRETSVDPARSKVFGLGSTTASEMIQLFEALHKRSLVNAEASEAMLSHLRACDDKDKFPRFLPEGAKIAFKTGSVDEARTAAGLIECGQGAVALCVLTNKNEDRRWVVDNAGNRLCAEVARAVYEHYRAEP